jgi:hypothetical protein
MGAGGMQPQPAGSDSHHIWLMIWYRQKRRQTWPPLQDPDDGWENANLATHLEYYQTSRVYEEVMTQVTVQYARKSLLTKSPSGE